MGTRPDLSFPSIPDVEQDAASSRQRTISVEQGGINLRESSTPAEFEWPESGPSGLLVEEKEKVKSMGPFGAKALASMTGAVVVSLLSEQTTERHL